MRFLQYVFRRARELRPVLQTTLDDDNVETRRLCCVSLDALLTKLGPRGLDDAWRACLLYKSDAADE